ncbi:MAG: helix-turn-helix domain-containing protein [Planctomycetota bacterium]|nr:helix-turn-helix domain-containing protein [Planctomycetota bacterium]
MTTDSASFLFDSQMVTRAQWTVLEAIETHWRGHMQPPTIRDLADATGIDYQVVHYHVSVLRKMGLVTKESGKSRTLRTARMMVSTVRHKGEPFQAVFWGDGGYEVKELPPIVKAKATSAKETTQKVGKKS